jgi:hypothetical protein
MATPTIKPRRNRLWYAAVMLAVIAAGLASRRYPWLFPDYMGKYPGDAFWALMVFLGWGIIFPGISTGRIALYALATSFVDEFSQLYHAAWIDRIRATFLGHIILGEWFNWPDLVAYAIGILIGVVGEITLLRGGFRRHSSGDSGTGRR